MDNHDSCKFNESLVSNNNNNMLCLLHFLVSLPKRGGGRGKKWGGGREKDFFARFARKNLSSPPLSKSDLRACTLGMGVLI